jgi:hypothetical protein
VQIGVVGKLLLGQPQLLATGLDGETKGSLEGQSGWHAGSLSGACVGRNDIRVDIAAAFSLQFLSMTFK